MQKQTDDIHFKELVIGGVNSDEMEKAQKRWDSIAKPLGSLGKLEDIVIRLAGISGHDAIDLSKKCVLVMCADNGVVDEGISQSGSDVTRIVAENMTQGMTTVNILSQSCGADVFVVDIGIRTDVANERMLHRKVMYGTKNLSREPAMSRSQALQAIRTGIDLVGELKDKGYRMIATGEMGIGNTTTSSAMTSCLLNRSAAEVTGRGAGLSSSGLEKKIQVIEAAIKIHRPDPLDPIDVLSKVGGLDIAGLTGVFLGGGVHRVPVLIDGFISSVAAYTAQLLCPESKHFMFATHLSKEPAGKLLLDALKLPHLVDLDMCLGEGTGAVTAFPLFDMALSVYRRMSSFEEVKIDAYQKLV
jgi:nicotinate-nucleotide--dimethylbenzimidazole phosphoribosyltransferase